jgi:cbb3-type cytochrome oxidase cytochrome c subunit
VDIRPGEWVVFIGSGSIAAFAVLVGTLIYLKPPPVQFIYLESPLSKHGETIFRRENCLSCHEVFGNGTSYGPDLDGVGSRRSPSWLRQYLEAPAPGVGIKTYRLKMPAYDELPPADLDALVAYLQGLREVEVDKQLREPSG